MSEKNKIVNELDEIEKANAILWEINQNLDEKLALVLLPSKPEEVKLVSSCVKSTEDEDSPLVSRLQKINADIKELIRRNEVFIKRIQL